MIDRTDCSIENLASNWLNYAIDAYESDQLIIHVLIILVQQSLSCLRSLVVGGLSSTFHHLIPFPSN